MITQWYDPEGASAALPGVISRALAGRGNEVHVLTGFPNYPSGTLADGYRVRPYQREDIRGVIVHRAPLWANHDTNGARRAGNYLSYAAGASAVGLTRFPRTDANLVHMTPATAALPALALKKLRGTPYVLHVQDLWPDTVLNSDLLTGGARAAGTLLHAMCDRLYADAAAIAVTSPGMADLIAARGVAREKIAFVPNWADEKAFRPVSRDEELARRLGTHAPFTVMYAGNFGEYQCLDTLLYAADILRNHENIRFVLVGEGVDEDRLKDIAADRDLKNVTFVPVQPFDDMARIMALGDLHYIALKGNPLFERTIPSKIQATLCAGRPVVAAISGDAANVLKASGAAQIIDNENADQLAASILRLSQLSKAELNAVGERATAYYDENFAEDAVSRVLLRLLAQAAQTAGRRKASR